MSHYRKIINQVGGGKISFLIQLFLSRTKVFAYRSAYLFSIERVETFRCNKEYTIEELDGERLLPISDTRLWRIINNEYMNEHSQCYVIRYKDIIVGSCRYYEGRFYVCGYSFLMDARYVFNVYIMPKFRDKKIATDFICHVSEELLDTNNKPLYVLVDYKNSISIRLFRRLGCKIAKIHYFLIFGVKLCMTSFPHKLPRIQIRLGLPENTFII